MNHATLEFLRQRFSEYYRKGTLMTPPSIEQREWGFIFFDVSSEVRMRRHMAFETPDEAITYMRSMVPAHVYYSTAYYALPGAATMNDKVWSGADLIFDLDADHLMRGPYDTMLVRVKEETIKLLGMLIEELGFTEKEIFIAFSGGRGYHVHIRRSDIREWGSQERRELVDYVCGIGIDPSVMIKQPCTQPGWGHRYRKALATYLKGLHKLDREEAVSRLRTLEGMSRSKRPETLCDGLEVLIGALESGRRIALNDRMLRVLTGPENSEFTAILHEQAARADEPVTTDIKRLIRLPSSLHGGSGLRVIPLTVGELHDFDPLDDAVVFGDADVRVDLAFPLSMPMLGTGYTLKKGENTVPEALAVFLCCRGIADLSEGGLSRRA
ncbi:MAG: DNA primase [Methanoculleus sp. SDB]|nr:MAG: DNA primase [Methanoculleus sp. SDB]